MPPPPTPNRAKLTPLEAFQANVADAHHLLDRVEVFTNQRKRRARRELRAKVGDFLSLPKSRWDDLDCLESDDVFVMFKPDTRLGRDDFNDHSPLLRQAIVAGCAAFETYIADVVMDMIGDQLVSGKLSPKAAEIPLTLGDWMEIDTLYQQKKRGLRPRIVSPWVYRESSTAPAVVGHMMKIVGVQNWEKTCDKDRAVKSGTTRSDLQRITNRRNAIAHNGDRSGRGRAAISLQYVKDELRVLAEVVGTIERLRRPVQT